MTKSLIADALDGAKIGVIQAAMFAVMTTIGYAINHKIFVEIGFTLWGVIIGYLISGAIIGCIAGLLRKYTTRLIGAFFVGVVAFFPVAVVFWVFFFRPKGVPVPHGLAVALVSSILLGGIGGLIEKGGGESTESVDSP